MRARRWWSRLAAATAASVVGLVLTACGGSGSSGLNGAQLVKPLTLSPITLTDTNGQPYQLAPQKDVLTLVYFGYTNCPDVCPTTMADIGAALRSLPASDAQDVQVVLITTDPERDTPPVLKKWLANFDSGVPKPFVGLTGSLSQITSYAKQLGVPLEPPTVKPDGSVEVTHGAQTIAFSPQDGLGHLVWTNGTLPTQYASDIRSLLRQVPAA